MRRRREVINRSTFMNPSVILPPSVGARVACEDRDAKASDKQQSLSASASKLDGHGGGITIPENIEELIEAYLTQQANREIAAGIKRPHLIVSIGTLCGEVSFNRMSCYERQGHVAGDTLKEAVDKRIAEIESHDPIKERQEKIAKLQRECAQIEAERGLA